MKLSDIFVNLEPRDRCAPTSKMTKWSGKCRLLGMKPRCGPIGCRRSGCMLLVAVLGPYRGEYFNSAHIRVMRMFLYD